MKKLKLLSISIGSIVSLAVLFYVSRDEVKTVEYSINQKNETILVTKSYDQANKFKQILENISESKDELDYAQAMKEFESIANEKDLDKVKYLIRKSDDRRKANLIRLDSVRKVFILRNSESGRELSFVTPPSDTKYRIVDRKYVITRRKSKFSDRARYHLEVIDYAETDGLELNDNDMFLD